MNIRQIRELAQILRQNSLSAIEVTEGENHVRLECCMSGAAPMPAQPAAGSLPQTAEAMAQLRVLRANLQWQSLWN